MNLLLADVGGEQLIVQFTGESIPGVARIIKEDYEKNGKWSKTTWSVELADGIHGFSLSQDWETGKYLTPSWDATVARFRSAAGVDVSRAAVERFVRAFFRSEKARASVAMMDAGEIVLSLPSGPVLAELMAAQEELAAAQAEHRAIMAEISAIEQAENDRAEAAALRERTAKARNAMAKGASLADLKSLLA
ncbi:MAG: hypothetical protein EOM22_17510 [Gammaproteobacteria bacterium]|nr:hypothetical protein [Gammaproteobacteria bacterium]